MQTVQIVECMLCCAYVWGGGYHGGSPTVTGNPALCGSCPLVTLY